MIAEGLVPVHRGTVTRQAPDVNASKTIAVDPDPGRRELRLLVCAAVRDVGAR
jgi:hypothetical protein